MAHYLDPKYDLTFKRVFGEHKHLCMSLINSMLPLKMPIVSIEYLPSELVPEKPDVLRNSIVDVRCIDAGGRQFIVEMQLFWSEYFKSRVLLNASKIYVMQLDKGEDYELLQPVYAISFLNETFEKSNEMQNEYYHYYKIVNVKHTGKQIEGLEFLFIELPKFKPLNLAEKKLHELWLRFLTEINENTNEAPKDLLDNELTREAVSYMERAAYTKEQLAAYDQGKIDRMTARGVINDAKREGEAIGLEKGEAIGIEKGEQKKAVFIAQNLLEMGMSVEDVRHSTGLSKKQIENLRNNGNSE